DNHISLVFETPALCHAPMETPAASMQFKGSEALEVWAPTQAPDHAQRAIAERVALPLERVTVHTVPMGGAFGRKRYTDYLEELAEATKHLFEQNIRERITLIWTREDDMSREFYRPATLQHVEWNNASPQQLSLKLYEGFSEAKHSEPRNIETDLPLNLSIDGSKVALKHHFSVGIWRSVHHGYHAFALCSTVDEMCIQTQTAPTAFYLEHAKQASLVERITATVTDTPSISSRLRGVVTKALQLADEDNTAANDTARGFAAYSVFGSHIALLSEINLNNAQLTVTRVWAAVDCGLAINPDKIKAQIEGGILYGLSACLYGDMPREKDSQALNFDVLPVLRMVDTPDIQINVVASQEPPTGAGELGVPVIAPAVCNAIRRLTPYRFTRLPLLKEGRLNFDHAVKIGKS
ncbi:MAG: molybdopterin cofactor-binding domain-containing protein, partial [Oleiphilaceae bacterium]|nr:molybdopterin cofactor-binding domain-containing protein [Oleiphilaceae bacterium]